MAVLAQQLTLILAQEDLNLLGDDFFSWVVLALGGALLVGNVLALVRPPENPKEGELDQAPVARSIIMAAVGGIAAIWALATLLS